MIRRNSMLLARWSAALFMCAVLFGARSAVAEDGSAYRPTVLITGANRGIGFEFAKQYAALGWRVIATARNPDGATDLQALAGALENMVVERLDVNDLAGVDELAERYAGQAVDVLINNAAISGSPSPRQLLGRIDYDVFDTFMDTNVRGPVKVTEAFLPHVKASRMKRIVAISSVGGSFGAGGREARGTMVYRATKAALNMLMVNIATAVDRYDVTVLMLNPGLVDTQGVLTAMNEKMNMGLNITPIDTSVGGMIAFIESAEAANSGNFYQWSGEQLPF